MQFMGREKPPRPCRDSREQCFIAIQNQSAGTEYSNTGEKQKQHQRSKECKAEELPQRRPAILGTCALVIDATHQQEQGDHGQRAPEEAKRNPDLQFSVVDWLRRYVLVHGLAPYE